MSVTVRNAADEQQVQHGARKESRQAKRRHDLVRAQLDTYAGRRLWWDELEAHQIFHQPTLWTHEAIYEFLGRRGRGIELWWELRRHFPTQLLQMQQEAYEREQRDDRETDAVQTPPAERD